MAGYADEARLHRPAIYLEHGAGQRYLSTNSLPLAGAGAYSGGPGHERTILFLCPSETVAGRWRETYPNTPATAVGCPRLDWWHAHPGTGGGGDRPTLAITFHSDARVCPESASAWRHYEPHLKVAIGRLRAAGWEVLGHAHPRIRGTLERFWSGVEVEMLPRLDDVFRRADVLAFDNTSAGPEFASTGRPIIFMDAPWWRRHVNHGGRFWDWPQGQISIDHADQLPTAAERAYARSPEVEAARTRMVRAVYFATDGHATERAVAAVLEVIPAPSTGV